MAKRKGIEIKVPLWDNQLVHNLLVAFIVLKLCGVIDWSLIWVLSPKWIQLVSVFLIGLWNEWKSFTPKL